MITGDTEGHGDGVRGKYGLKNRGEMGDEGVDEVGVEIVDEGESGNTIPVPFIWKMFLLIEELELRFKLHVK